MEFTRLTRYGLLSVSGPDARAFLQAQLTSDVSRLGPAEAALAGWCSAKGRLLATFLVVGRPDGFLLQLARDLAPAIAKRLSMFVLRSKVTVSDVSEAWGQLGVWGPGANEASAGLPEAIAARVAPERMAVFVPAARLAECEEALARSPGARKADETDWALQEIRAGRPLVTAATQDAFVPQMVNLERLGGVDFRKGCYPGQEVVARAQYRGQVKRRMVRARLRGGPVPAPGESFGGGTVVDAAPSAEGTELLLVVPDESEVERLPLPYET